VGLETKVQIVPTEFLDLEIEKLMVARTWAWYVNKKRWGDNGKQPVLTFSEAAVVWAEKVKPQDKPILKL